MTLIAYTISERVPIVVGDLLLTINERIEGIPQIELPNFSAKLEDISNDFSKVQPIGLSQKIYVINDVLCIALSGLVYEMTAFLRAIRINFENKKPDKSNVLTFLDDYKGSLDNTNFLVLLADEINKPIKILTEGHWLKTSNRWFSTCIANGTGAKSFIKELERLGTNDFLQIGSDKSSQVYIAKTQVLGLLMQLIVNEKISLSNIKDFWGGGFELITIDNKGFKKADNITYIIWDTNLDENGELVHKPEFIVNYKYYSDLLVITPCEMAPINKQYFIPPLDKPVEYFNTDLVPKYPDFDKGTIVSIWLLKSTKGFYFLNTATFDNYCCEIHEPKIKISLKDDKSLDVRLNPEEELAVFENIHDWAKKFVKENRA